LLDFSGREVLDMLVLFMLAEPVASRGAAVGTG
jgi:hypothetical protein